MKEEKRWKQSIRAASAGGEASPGQRRRLQGRTKGPSPCGWLQGPGPVEGGAQRGLGVWPGPLGNLPAGNQVLQLRLRLSRTQPFAPMG